MTPLVKQTILSQYANSPILMALVENLTDAVDPSANITDFYNIFFNVLTAQGQGLDVWGEIVGIDRYTDAPLPDGDFFGFTDGFFPFGQAPFFHGSGRYALTDEAFRQLILIKAMKNILYATAPNINLLMKSLFLGKKAYFLLTGHMKARYVFEFNMSPWERHLAFQTDILPRPCGVEVESYNIIPPETFGFYGSGLSPFGQGTFYDPA